MISPVEYRRLAGLEDDNPNAGEGYSALPEALLIAEQSIALESVTAASALNRDLCRNLLERFSLSDACLVLPGQFKALYAEQLARIERQLISADDGYFRLGNDVFRKDLAILRHRLVPCGAELATPYSGIQRSLLFRGGLGQAVRLLGVLALSRGVKPFLELHMHPQHLVDFSPAGWIRTYENLADLLEANPALLGVQSTSWFLDPSLATISPHLAYLRKIPERSGALFFYAGEDSKGTSGALAISQTRRSLFKAGTYRPRLFTRIWLRQRLLARGWRALPDREVP